MVEKRLIVPLAKHKLVILPTHHMANSPSIGSFMQQNLSGTATLEPPVSSLSGFFVTSKNEPEMGIGKVLSVSSGEVLVEYFVSPRERIQETHSINTVVRTYLENQTRCFYETAEGYKTGRIEMRESDHYWVRCGNNVRELMPETALFVRCNRTIDDPTVILAEKAIESPFFFHHRQTFVRAQVEQRATSNGLTGLLSAGIQLYPHQVEVARRVLADPIQRYLLADENGLGKTIEAGILLRQFLNDNPEGRVLILVPSHLKEHWRRELDGKLGLLDFGDPYQLITPTELLNSSLIEEEFMALVVDEAHLFVSGAFSTEQMPRMQFLRLCTLAKMTPKVLLLSSTPVLHNEQNYLAMLHLLDPNAYSLEDVKGFKRRVADRQSIGKLILNLQGKVQPASLQLLAEAFPEDTYVQEAVPKVLNAIQDESTREPLVGALCLHLSETYRLHRRMLRNRRDSIEDVRNFRGALAAEYDLDDQVGEIAALLEDWRTSLHRALDNNHSGDRTDWETLYLLLVSATGSWLGMLDAIIDARLNRTAAAWLKKEYSQSEIAAIIRLPLFPGEAELLRSIQEMMRSFSDGEGDRIGLLKELLAHHFAVRFGLGNGRVVVFTGYQKVAAEIFQGLSKAYGAKGIARYLREDDEAKHTAELKRFQQDPSCWLLICDSSGEDGLNLQEADAVIHFDLPFQPNRVEQRMASLDRLGRKKDFKTLVLVGPEHDLSMQECWSDILQNGFGVFSQSIASLQALVNERLPHLLTTAFVQGPQGLRDECEQLRKTIPVEQENIAEQQAIDEIDIREQGAVAAFERLRSMDAQSDLHRKSIQGLAEGVFQFRPTSAREGGLFYRYQDSTLMPPKQFLSFCRGGDFSPAVFAREEALTHPGLRVYRSGHPFVDSLAEYIDWDDRGKVFAIWRNDPRWPENAEPWAGFYFTFMVEADLELARDILKKEWGKIADPAALLRRADALFSPTFITIAFDAQKGTEETNPLVMEILEQGNYKKNTVNLGSRLWLLERFIEPSQWAEKCRETRVAAEQALKERESFTEHLEKQGQKARESFTKRLVQLQQRQYNGTLTGDKSQVEAVNREIAQEAALSEAFFQGIVNPQIRLDSVGFAVISQTPPPKQEP